MFSFPKEKKRKLNLLISLRHDFIIDRYIADPSYPNRRAWSFFTQLAQILFYACVTAPIQRTDLIARIIELYTCPYHCPLHYQIPLNNILYNMYIHYLYIYIKQIQVFSRARLDVSRCEDIRLSYVTYQTVSLQICETARLRSDNRENS